MHSFNSSISACRLCRHYTPEGRRGGVCQLLHVAVESKWDACSMATAPFSPTWKEFEEAALLQQSVTEIAAGQEEYSRHLVTAEKSQAERYMATEVLDELPAAC